MITKRKGLILAGGLGTRLFPLTRGISKQLLPVFDKPMIYYSLSVLMLAGIREIAIITTPQDQNLFKQLLGNGNQWGIKLTYIKQKKPRGIAEVFILAENFLSGSPSLLILGDNIFFGHGLVEILKKNINTNFGSVIFTYNVNNPSRYGVVDYDKKLKIRKFIEKPKKPKSNYAITGLYFFDGSVSKKAKKIKPSKRGELEIISLLNIYLAEKNISVEKLGRGYAWLDVGTHNSLLDAGNFIKTIQDRQGQQIGCLEEIAFNNKWINKNNLKKLLKICNKNYYTDYLKKLL